MSDSMLDEHGTVLAHRIVRIAKLNMTADVFDSLAHQLLDELETRHDQLLADLEELNKRVDQVLGQYTQVRPDEPSSAPDESAEEDDE